MKFLKVIAVAMLAPMLLLASANADEGKGKKQAATSKKPSLTYYYFDG